nr:hypothetical protein GCM10017745_33940 [Saccharothrix mutabilis subsp. capreolus]
MVERRLVGAVEAVGRLARATGAAGKATNSRNPGTAEGTLLSGPEKCARPRANPSVTTTIGDGGVAVSRNPQGARPNPKKCMSALAGRVTVSTVFAGSVPTEWAKIV